MFSDPAVRALVGVSLATALVWLTLRHRQRNLEVEFLSHHLCALLRRNLSLAIGLEALAQEAALGLRRRLLRLSERLRAGTSLADSLARERSWIPAEIVTVTRAADHAGALARVLGPATAALRARADLVLHLYAGFAYAGVVLTYVLTADAWITRFAVTTDFASPPVPSVPSGLEQGMAVAAWSLLLGLAAWVLWLEFVRERLRAWRWLRQPIDALAGCLPIVSGMARRTSAARYAGVLAALLKAGVAPTQAFTAAAEAEPNDWLRRRLERATDAVRTGIPAAEAMRRAGLPEPLPWLAGAADGTAGFPDALQRAAEDLTAGVLHRMALLRRVTTPALILLLGLLVGLTGNRLFSLLRFRMEEILW